MIEYILYMITVWFIVGFVAAFVDLFIFFRGMKHMIECYVNHKNTTIKLIGFDMAKRYNENPLIFYFAFFGIYSSIGAITVFMLISDFFRFTFPQK